MAQKVSPVHQRGLGLQGDPVGLTSLTGRFLVRGGGADHIALLHINLQELLEAIEEIKGEEKCQLAKQDQ